MGLPLHYLGARLLFVLAAGGLWAVGYLVSPFLAERIPAHDIVVLRKSMMLLALLGFAVVFLARAQQLRWQVLPDAPAQIGAATILSGILFIVVPAAQAQVSAGLYFLVSLLAIAWIALTLSMEDPT
jgi:hypothetical protein